VTLNPNDWWWELGIDAGTTTPQGCITPTLLATFEDAHAYKGLVVIHFVEDFFIIMGM
jgi:hypothetical protein